MTKAVRAHGGALLLACLLAGCGVLRREGVPPVPPAEAESIEREVSARLAAEPSIGAGNVRVELQGRTLVLYGSVRGLGALQCAIRNAELVEGVQSVVDYLVLERGPRDVECLAPRAFPAEGE